MIMGVVPAQMPGPGKVKTKKSSYVTTDRVGRNAGDNKRMDERGK